MPANDAILFIDANKYLDLYRTNTGKKLLAPLAEQAEYIFVTQQVVNEVQRNKLLIAAEFLNKQFNELKLQTFNVPDHLTGENVEHGKEILAKMREISQKIKELNVQVDELGWGIIDQISRAEDTVSKAIAPIFAKAVGHTPEELQRARDRRELGNPPGKMTNPIGDQLTWEQILTHFKGKKRLWIISRDGDYGILYDGKGFLNQFLMNELRQLTASAEAYLFEDTVQGIQHFVAMTGVKAEQQLTPEETEEIKREEQTLPFVAATSHFDSASSNIVQMAASEHAKYAAEVGSLMGTTNSELARRAAKIGAFSQKAALLGSLVTAHSEMAKKAALLGSFSTAHSEISRRVAELGSLVGTAHSEIERRVAELATVSPFRNELARKAAMLASLDTVQNTMARKVAESELLSQKAAKIGGLPASVLSGFSQKTDEFVPAAGQEEEKQTPESSALQSENSPTTNEKVPHEN